MNVYYYANDINTKIPKQQLYSLNVERLTSSTRIKIYIQSLKDKMLAVEWILYPVVKFKLFYLLPPIFWILCSSVMARVLGL